MNANRVLPHDLEAEKALIGAVLVNADHWSVVQHVPVEAFYRQAHGFVWGTIGRLLEAGSPVDQVTLHASLRASGALEEVGVAAYGAFVDGVPKSSNAEHYAAIVLHHAANRQRITAWSALIDSCYLPIDDAETTQTEAEATLAAIDTGRQGSSLLDAEGQIAALIDELERDTQGPKVYLGLPAIDEQIGGIRPGEVLGLMARPGLGKTLVLCHALCGLVQSMPVACFSLEMPAAQIVKRLARMQFGLSHWHLRQGQLDISQYLDWFAGLRLDGSPSLSVAQMGARVRRLKAKGIPVRVVCVDHLGLIGGDRTLSTYDRVSTQARELKDLAKREDVAIVLLVQVNRDSGGDGSRELHLGSARDSGVVEEALDYAVALRRLDRSTALGAAEREKFRDVLFAKVLKHRHGGVAGDEFAYRLDDQSLRLTEDLSVKPDASDLASIAAAASKGGRR